MKASGSAGAGAGMGQTTLTESLRGVEAEIAAGHPDRALTLCQEVQARYPRALPVQRVLGEVYLALRKPREALGALDRALAGNPEDARACCARALVHQIHGDSLAALSWYRRACDISPDDAMLRSAYRELAAPLGQPAYGPTRMGLARLYLRGDLFPHAIREWESLLAEQPDALEAQVGLAETLWRAHQTQAATERCRRIVTNAPSCAKALLIQAAIAHDAGQADEAQRLVRRVAELDPDQRIGQSLFADRIAAGDHALRALLLGPENVPAQSAAAHAASLAPALTTSGSVSRPATPSQPLAPPLPEQATYRMPTPTSQPLPAASAAGNMSHESASSTTPRPSTLPPDFHTIFAETEYMLWGRDEHGNEDGSAAGHGAYDRSRADVFARSSAFVPPALREQGGSLEDTEARAAINWINWLQAQGARPVGGMPPRPLTGPLTGPLTAPYPASGASAMPPGAPPNGWMPATGPLPPMQTGPLPPAPTGPLPQPTPEALRAMFAELEPEASTRRIVDGDIVDAGTVAAPEDAPAREAAYTPHDAPEEVASFATFDDDGDAAPAWSDSEAQMAGWTMATQLPEEIAHLAEQPADEAPSDEHTPEPERYAPEPSASFDGPHAGATTLESLERGFADSGFANFELRGELSSLTDTPEHADPGVWASDATPEAPEVARSHSTQPAQADEPALPASDDYPGRLALARQRRGDGNLDDALNEYRMILKNAPDLLGEVVSELQESLAAAPDHPEVHRLLGDARIRQGDYLSALEAYNRAVALTQPEED